MNKLKPIEISPFWIHAADRAAMVRDAAEQADRVARAEAALYPDHVGIMDLPRNHYNNYLIDYRVNQRNANRHLDLYALPHEWLFVRIFPLLPFDQWGVVAFFADTHYLPGQYGLIGVEGLNILSTKRQAWQRARKISARYQAADMRVEIDFLGWLWDLPRDPARWMYQHCLAHDVYPKSYKTWW